jgi:hypothetical protein
MDKSGKFSIQQGHSWFPGAVSAAKTACPAARTQQKKNCKAVLKNACLLIDKNHVTSPNVQVYFLIDENNRCVLLKSPHGNISQAINFRTPLAV